MLLLELPQLSVDVKRPSEVGLPLLVSVLRKVPVGRRREGSAGRDKPEDLVFNLYQQGFPETVAARKRNTQLKSFHDTLEIFLSLQILKYVESYNDLHALQSALCVSTH